MLHLEFQLVPRLARQGCLSAETLTSRRVSSIINRMVDFIHRIANGVANGRIC